MVEEKRTVTVPEGEITYTLSVKPVKNMNLRVRPDGTVAVSVSRRVPKPAADDFVRSHAGWIRARLAKREAGPAPLEFPEREEAMRLLIASLERVWPLVEPLGVAKPVLKGRAMTSRWGSCHCAKGVIVMNTALAAVPEELLDYVTLHELVHFLHPNHGKGFYAVLGRLMPDYAARRKRLREYAIKQSRK